MTEMSTPWGRLEQVIRRANMTTNYFARYIGLIRGENLYQIKRGNNGISFSLAERICHYFPEINKMWLLTGEGHMLCSEGHHAGGIPYYEADVESSIRDLATLTPSMFLQLPQSVRAEIAMQYCGRAMGEQTPSGTIVLLQKIDPDAIIPGSECVIISKKIVTLRIVRAMAGEAALRLEAVDRSRFDDIVLPAEQIEAAYVVRGKLIINN